jgi:hypothetical protein
MTSMGWEMTILDIAEQSWWDDNCKNPIPNPILEDNSCWAKSEWGSEAEIVEINSWCMDNLSYGFSWIKYNDELGLLYTFTDETDAVLFRLRWG